MRVACTCTNSVVYRLTAFWSAVSRDINAVPRLRKTAGSASAFAVTIVSSCDGGTREMSSRANGSAVAGKGQPFGGGGGGGGMARGRGGKGPGRGRNAPAPTK